MKTPQTFCRYFNSDMIYLAEDAEWHLPAILYPDWKKQAKGKTTIEYLNLPISFDIETTSAYRDGKKTAWMYVWTMNINGASFIGRTWEQWFKVIDTIRKICGTNINRRVIIYVQNLAYEFGFICKRFSWETVFASEEPKVIYALDKTGIEFRCSYFLSGSSLEKMGKDLTRYKVKKLVGDLDYSLVRHSRTHLTDKEIGYCVNDTKVLSAYIQEQIEDYKGIQRIPLTNTGRVRKHMRDACLYKNKESWKYRKMISQCTLTPDEYKQCRLAYHGGFTHSNPYNTDKVIDNVSSYDFTSSYPAVMLAERYPYGKPIHMNYITQDQWKNINSKYFVIYDCVFRNIRAKENANDFPISSSKCWQLEGEWESNGRVIEAKHLATTTTNIDMQVIHSYYDWDEMKVGNVMYWKVDYLPKEIVECVLDMYEAKTTLKGVLESITEYLLKKGMLNSSYGCMVQNIVKDIETFVNGDGWTKQKVNVESCIDDYNHKEDRFNYYPWGLAITSYAFRNLFMGIRECGDDYIYADTDSVKFTNEEKHRAWFEKYNKWIIEKIEKCLEHYGINPTRACPKTIKGVKKPIGVWDFSDGHYDKFKTLGAKRYCYTEDGEFHITVAGLGKKASKYIESLGDPFEVFADGLSIPAEETGKMTHTYCYSPCDGDIVDYLGVPGHYHEESFIHLEPCPFKLKLQPDFIDTFTEIQHIIDKALS